MDQGRRNAERKAVGLLVKLKHTSVVSFIQEYAVNISPGGMFIRSREPQPVGTPVRFEVRIADGQRMLKGSAVVRWTRPVEDVTGPAGMGIQFTELDTASESIVERMLTHKSTVIAQRAAPPAVAAPSSTKLPSVAPVVAPVAPIVPPVPPRASAVHIPAVAPALTPAPKPAAAAPPPRPAAPVAPPPQPPPPPRPTSAVDISLDELLAFTPVPAAAAEADPFDLGPDDEYSPQGPKDFGLTDLSAAATPVPAAPAPVAPPAPAPAPAQRGSAVELELDSSEDDEPLEFARPVAGHQPSRPVAKKPAPAPPPPAPVARPTVSTPVVVPPAARPTASTPAVAPPPAARPTVSTPAVAPTLAPAKPAALPPEPKTSPGQVRTVFLTPPTGDIEGKGPVIGVDLGTSNSCVAVMANNKPIVLRSREGYNTIPSVVSLSSQGKLLVSHRAKSQVLLRPEQTIYGAKRLVGRPFDSAVVNQVRERFHYEIMPDARGRAAVRMGEHVLSLEEVQGIILRECKELAEQHLGQKVERAVVTVPAYYSEPQREAVRRAGWMAGLKVERILNEPTSAALAYGLNRDMAKRVLVYDLGGGTFDATVLRIDKNVFEVMATGGDIFLGGMDFDNKLVDLMLERFLKQEKVHFQGDRVALSRVTDAAERAKVALSESNSYEVHIPMLMMDDAGRPRDLHVTLTRAEMEAVCMPMVLRTLDVVGDVLLDAKLRVGDVDDILLVGGQSRMPLVREKLKEMFGRAPHAGVNTDEAVALGAALYSSAVDRVSSVVLIDVLPMTIGVAMPGGAFTRVIERNTPLPAQRSFAISTTRDNEEVMELSIFQGEDTHISANEYLGTVRLEGLPKGPKGAVRVAVTLRLDSECVLHVNAQEYSTRKEMKATLATRYSPEELRHRLGVAKDAAQAAEERRGQDLKERSGRFWGFLKKVVGKG
ncbi:TIGR02266 family protein [Archangium primigenium]|uniref:TIGR02266 family protein n=1 Tax=[Archangium] primigenium TaxID=2792470 RepID=UPI00195681A1|nr:TIGR02266 family protein [Archangium primigenium]MBM7113320.1 TIGR02266 family protein [Archangium primigenium]